MKKTFLLKKTPPYSAEHKKFVRNEKLKTFFVHFTRIAILLLFIGLWELSASTNFIDPFITSSPSRIIDQIKSLLEAGTLWTHIWTTLNETLIAFALSTIIGFVVAILLYEITPVRRVLEPYIVVLNSLPKIALGPLIIIWAGTGTSAIVTMGVLICVVITTINLLGGYMGVSKEKVMLLKSMGANRFQILGKLIIPATLPNFVATLKINLGMAWVGVIMGEYLSSKAGLGYLLVYGGQVFKLDLVMTAIVILCVLSAIMYGIITIIEKIIVKNR